MDFQSLSHGGAIDSTVGAESLRNGMWFGRGWGRHSDELRAEFGHLSLGARVFVRDRPSSREIGIEGRDNMFGEIVYINTTNIV